MQILAQIVQSNFRSWNYFWERDSLKNNYSTTSSDIVGKLYWSSVQCGLQWLISSIVRLGIEGLLIHDSLVSLCALEQDILSSA